MMDQILEFTNANNDLEFLVSFDDGTGPNPSYTCNEWGNLYSEIAIAIAAQHDGQDLPDSFNQFPKLIDGKAGVAFIEAAFASNAAGGIWVSL